MIASVFSSCIDNALPSIVASTPIVHTLPDPVAFTFATSITIVALYSDSLTLYSDIPYSAIKLVATVNACLLKPSV